MAEQEVSFATATGQHECTILLAGPSPSGGSKASFKTGFLRVMDMPESVPQQGVTITVPTGAGPLVAAITDEEGNAPEGVSFSVMTPSHEVLDQPTPVTDTARFVNVSEGGSLRSLVVAEPEPGDWTIQVNASETAGEYYVIFYTTPTADAYDTLIETAASMIDEEAYSLIEARVGIGKMGCKRCKALFWAAAISLAVLAIASTAVAVLMANPVVGAVAVLVGITLVEFVSWLVREGKKYGGSTSKWAEGLCRKRGDC